MKKIKYIVKKIFRNLNTKKACIKILVYPAWENEIWECTEKSPAWTRRNYKVKKGLNFGK